MLNKHQAARTLVLTVIAVWVVAGCTVDPGPTPIANPPADPLLACEGVPQDVCQGAVRDARLNAPRGTVPVRIQVACTAASCTPQQGQTKVDVQYSDGSISSYGTGWAGGAPGGAPGDVLIGSELSVQPICQGLPPKPCQEMALGVGTDPGDPAAVLSIIVRCTKPPCTAVSGDGDTIVTLDDGSTRQGSWSYRK